MITNRCWRDEQGVALLAAILIVSMLLSLGILSLNLATQEIQSTRAANDEAVLRHLAKAGVDLVIQWFHDPSSVPSGASGALFIKRHDLPGTGSSFFDAQGRSQFTGTAARPDLSVDAARPEDDRLLNDPVAGWFRALRHLGRVSKLRLYGPARPGLLCTVDITAEKAGVSRTQSVQLGTRALPPLRAGAQVGGQGTSRTVVPPGRPLPLWVHWGDLKVKGDAVLGRREEIPVKTALASVTGRSYADTMNREDRWLELRIGGEALFAPSATAVSAAVPWNVFARQDPFPGLKMDQWDYRALKKAARLFGSYYVMGRDGMLYQDGIMQSGHRRSPNDVFGSQAVGDHHGLVFVDTLDQQPPTPHNLGVLSLETDYAEGIFVVNAHVSWKPSGRGKSVPALSPPHDGSSPLGTRIPVRLTGVNLQGVLYAAGDVILEGELRIYGALVVGRSVVQASGKSGSLEIWYDHNLRGGLVRGVPLVYPVPGTWQEKY